MATNYLLEFIQNHPNDVFEQEVTEAESFWMEEWGK